MNNFLSKIEFRDVIALVAVIGTIFAFVSTLQKDIVVINNKLETYEDKMNSLESNASKFTTREESKLVMDRLDRIENKLDSILERR